MAPGAPPSRRLRTGCTVPRYGNGRRPPQGEREPPATARRATRRAYFEAVGAAGDGWRRCPVWRREALCAGNAIAGPAIIEEVSATTVLYPGDVAQVDAIGSLGIEVGS
jgi:N-methylhydantoinase A